MEEVKHLKCAICGFETNNLSLHIKAKHPEITCNEYKIKYNTIIVYISEEQRIQRSERGKKYYENEDNRKNNSERQKISQNRPEVKEKKSKSTKERGTIWNKNYWILQGCTDEEAKIKVKEVQKSNHDKRLAKDKEDEYQILNKNHWIKRRGKTKDEAIAIVHEMQSKRSAKSKKFRGKTHTDEIKKQIGNTISKNIQSIGADVWIKHFKYNGAHSQTEIKLYEYIKGNIEPNIACNISIQGRVADYGIGNKIIEFYGDFWHANPLVYKPDWQHPFSKRFAKDIQQLDMERINYIESFGYTVLIIWEKDYNENFEKTIEKIRNFLCY